MHLLLDCSSQGESSGDDNPHSLDLNEHAPNLNEHFLNPKKRAANPIEEKLKDPKRIRLTPKTFAPKTFCNEVDNDKEIPEKCCNVCCRLLYPEDYCRLSKPHKERIEEMFAKDRQTALGDGKSVPEIEKITWPLLNYRDQNGNQIQELHTHMPLKGPNKGEEYVIIKWSSELGNHHGIRFVNKHWMYPGCQPDELRNLHLRGEGFLCPILVFCELTNSRSKLTQATRAGHHFVSGRIGLYKSKEYLGAHVGTRGLVKLSDKKTKMKPEEKKKILRAWEWLKQNHPLIKQVDVDEPSDLMNASEKVVEREPESDERRNINESGFRACHMGPIGTGGPRTADESNNLDNMAIGILGRDQQIVKYSNPCLLRYLFPTLYPEGQGFFSKDYAGINGGQNHKVIFHDDNLDDHFVDGDESDEEDMDGYVSWSDSDSEGDKSEGNSRV
ncbi:MAG: hypothetical protein J3R72DRAFT_481202 [Linnemannia gamsii]|nr:MAG: hypothetical protein J3R72DRAFT_481202 [Linnemannia gamsii]